jgi:hypothetical protein
MGRVFQFAIALLWASAMLPAAHAQTPPAAPPPVPDGPRYIVAYVDVRPAESVTAVKVLRALRDEARRAPGNLRSEALQRFGGCGKRVSPSSGRMRSTSRRSAPRLRATEDAAAKHA